MYMQRKKHYWRLDTKCLTLYKSETSSQYFKEIALADILAVDPMVNPEVYPLNPPHVFEIVTSSMTFYVGVDMTGALPRDLLQKGEGTCMYMYMYMHVWCAHVLCSSSAPFALATTVGFSDVNYNVPEGNVNSRIIHADLRTCTLYM